MYSTSACGKLKINKGEKIKNLGTPVDRLPLSSVAKARMIISGITTLGDLLDQIRSVGDIPFTLKITSQKEISSISSFVEVQTGQPLKKRGLVEYREPVTHKIKSLVRFEIDETNNRVSLSKQASFVRLSIDEVCIEDLTLSTRSYNQLKRAQIHTLLDLLDYDEKDLLEIKKLGIKSQQEIIRSLDNYYQTFKKEVGIATLICFYYLSLSHLKLHFVALLFVRDFMMMKLFKNMSTHK